MNDPLLANAEGEQGFVVAKRTGGERALPTSEGLVLLSASRLCRHVLCHRRDWVGQDRDVVAPGVDDRQDQQGTRVLPGRQGRSQDS